MAKIKDAYIRSLVTIAQRSAVSTQDIVEQFMPLSLYNKIYTGLGCGKNEGPQNLTPIEISAISFALTAMANTILDVSKYVDKQKEK